MVGTGKSQGYIIQEPQVSGQHFIAVHLIVQVFQSGPKCADASTGTQLARLKILPRVFMSRLPPRCEWQISSSDTSRLS